MDGDLGSNIMEENKKTHKFRNRLVGLLIIVGMISVATIAAIYIKDGTINPFEATGDIYYSGGINNASIQANQFYKGNVSIPVDDFALNPTWNPITQDYRPRWTGCDDETFKTIFHNLPKFPQDFYKKYKLFMLGQLNDYERLGSEYWQQPEWYDLNQMKFSHYINGWEPYWNIGQVSCKPMVRMIEIKRGVTMNMSTYFHADISGSQAYLGGIIFAYLPNQAMDLYGKTVFLQPEKAKDYINVKITTPQNDPLFMSNEFQRHIKGLYNGLELGQRVILFPATRQIVNNQGIEALAGYPIDFVAKVSFEVTVNKNCPTGEYVVAVDLKNAASAVVEEYNWEISGSPYYSFFFNAIRETHPACPFFQLIMVVV